MSEKEKLKNAVLRCLDAGYGELVSMEPIERFIKNREKAKNEALANAEKALIPLAELNLVGVTGDIVYQRDKSYIKVSDISRAKESLAELRRVSGKI